MNRWLRIGLEGLLALVLALVILQFLRPRETSVVTPPATVNPNIPVGRLRFDDNVFYGDRAEINLANVPRPASGTHYEVWLKSEDGTVRDLGRIEFSATGSGRLEYNEPDAKNFLGLFNQVLVTLEQDDDSITEPTGEVKYSSVLPPQALKEIRHVLVSYEDTPEQGPLMQNFWWYNANYINRSINGDPFDPVYKTGILQAFQNGDEQALRKRTEEVINTITGSQSDLYQDYDKNGLIEEVGDGYGSLPNGDRLGYIQATILNAKNTVDAPDSTPEIRLNGENVQICLKNTTEWTEQLLDLALQLNETPFGPEMEPTIKEIAALGKTLLNGKDANKNQLFGEAIAGECGADRAYDFAYYMADMFLYPGADRMPPPEN